MLNFAKRNFKELIRDPLSLIFAILLPICLLTIFQIIKIPNEIYALKNFTPGIIIFGFSFVTLFASMLVSKDRTSSLLIPLIIIQNVLFFGVAIMLGLEFSINIILTVLVSIVVSLLFIGIGVLLGSCFSEKGAPSISSVVIQLVCFTSGMYFPKDVVGKGFDMVCKILPFESALNIVKGVMNGTEIGMRSILTFSAYTIVIIIIAICVFNKKMVSDDK